MGLLLSPNTPFSSGDWDFNAGSETHTENYAYGVDGTLTAWQMVDTSGIDISQIGQSIALPSDTLPYCFYFYVEKNSATAIPAILLRIGPDPNSPLIVSGVEIDTASGSVTPVSAGGWSAPYNTGSRGVGNYWLVWLTFVNNHYTKWTACVAPAFNDTLNGGGSVSFGGSAVFWGGDMVQGTSPATAYSISGAVSGAGAVNAARINCRAVINGASVGNAVLTGTVPTVVSHDNEQVIIDNLLYQPLDINFTDSQADEKRTILRKRGRAVIDGIGLDQLSPNVKDVLVRRRYVKVSFVDLRQLQQRSPTDVVMTGNAAKLYGTAKIEGNLVVTSRYNIEGEVIAEAALTGSLDVTQSTSVLGNGILGSTFVLGS